MEGGGTLSFNTINQILSPMPALPWALLALTQEVLTREQKHS